MNKGNKVEKIALIDNQIKDLFNTISNSNRKHRLRDEYMARVWLATGFRVSEMANFLVGWIEKGDKNDFIHIQQNKSPYAFVPKYGSSRRVPTPKKITKIINSYTGGRKTYYVFMPQTNKKYSRFHTKYLISMFNDYFKETKSIGRNLGSHTFRRTFASRLALDKVPIDKISQYLGHKSIKTTVLYLRQIKTDKHDEILSAEYINKLTNF